jgi:hypothetical protein
MGTSSFLKPVLPAGFAYAWYLAFIGQFPEADPANTVLAQVGVRAAAQHATAISACREFRHGLLFEFH